MNQRPKVNGSKDGTSLYDNGFDGFFGFDCIWLSTPLFWLCICNVCAPPVLIVSTVAVSPDYWLFGLMVDHT